MKSASVNDKILKNYLKVALAAALSARKVHSQYFKKLRNVRNKLDSSLVSEADHKSEKVIREILRKKFPQTSILGEEEGLESQRNKKVESKGRWLIDPLDGTTNYVHGYPFFCSSIGLEINGEVQVGVVDSFILKKTYWAIKGHGAFLRDGLSKINKLTKQKISTSKSKLLRDALIAIGFLTYGGNNLDFQVEIFKKFVQSAQGVRRSGSAALELCLVAEGVLDGFWEYGLQAWDTGAGSLIVKEAGGTVTNMQGKIFHPDDNAIIASNGLIHEEFSRLIRG